MLRYRKASSRLLHRVAFHHVAIAVAEGTDAVLAARAAIVVAMSAAVSLHKKCSAFVVSPVLWPAAVASISLSVS